MKIQISTRLTSVFAGAGLMLINTLAAAADAPSAAPDPRAILSQMGRNLAGMERFQAEIRSGYDSVQESGKKIEFMEHRTVTVDRPSRMRVEIEKSDGERSLVLVDGKTITAQSLGANVYAQTEARGTLDESILYFVRDLRMKLPLAMLMLSKLPDELERRLVDAAYVEKTSILGAPAHHIVGSTDDVDFQVWVSADKNPLPVRVVITYREEEGQPQFRAQFVDWKPSARVTDSMFEFKAPKDAHKIAFVTQVAAASVGASAAQGAK